MSYLSVGYVDKNYEKSEDLRSVAQGGPYRYMRELNNFHKKRARDLARDEDSARKKEPGGKRESQMRVNAI